MKILRGHRSLSPTAPAGAAGCALTIGNFDGVHRGHRAVLDRSARALLERETLDEAALVALTADLPRDG